MDHDEAVRTMATEKYLFGEFDAEMKEAFEEHFFSCQECAMDVRAGMALLDGSSMLAHTPEIAERAAVRPKTVRESKGNALWADWFAWLRPAFAVPAMALLLLVVGFQNMVQLPALRQTVAVLNAPEVLPSAYLASGSARGGEQRVVTARPNQPFLLLIDIPGEKAAGFVAELYDSADAKKLSLPIPGDTAKDTLPIEIPSGSYSAGEYTLVVRNDGGVEVARYAFQLRRP